MPFLENYTYQNNDRTSLYYAGDVSLTLLNGSQRYLYGLRREPDGTLYVNRFDQLSFEDQWILNNPGDPLENYPYENVTVGVDFLEGRDVNHEIVYENLVYEQWRWDHRYISYYINENGFLVARIGQEYNYQ